MMQVKSPAVWLKLRKVIIKENLFGPLLYCSLLLTDILKLIAIPSWVLLSGKRGNHWKPAEGAQPPAVAFISPKATVLTMACKASYMPDTVSPQGLCIGCSLCL